MKRYAIFNKTTGGYFIPIRGLVDSFTPNGRVDYSQELTSRNLFDNETEARKALSMFKIAKGTFQLIEVEVPDETGTVQESHGGNKV